MFKHKGLKVNAEDAALPKNRKDLFLTVLKDDFYLLAEISLLLFLFSLPLAGAFAFEFVLLAGQSSVTAQKVFSICFYLALAEIPLWGVRYIGRYAAFGVMKKRAHNEGGYVTELFFEFMKKGALRGFAIGAILGAVIFLWQIGCAFLLSVSDNSILKGLGIGGATVLFLIAYGAAENFLAGDVFYELSFLGCLKNSFVFCLAAFPVAALHFAINMGLPLILTFVSYYSLIGVGLLWAFWADGVSCFAATLYSHKLFDKYINSVYYTDYIKKGLSREEKEKKNG